MLAPGYSRTHFRDQQQVNVGRPTSDGVRPPLDSAGMRAILDPSHMGFSEPTPRPLSRSPPLQQSAVAIVPLAEPVVRAEAPLMQAKQHMHGPPDGLEPRRFLGSAKRPTNLPPSYHVTAPVPKASLAPPPPTLKLFDGKSNQARPKDQLKHSLQGALPSPRGGHQPGGETEWPGSESHRPGSESIRPGSSSARRFHTPTDHDVLRLGGAASDGPSQARHMFDRKGAGLHAQRSSLCGGAAMPPGYRSDQPLR